MKVLPPSSVSDSEPIKQAEVLSLSLCMTYFTTLLISDII
jgi:hypothetical protein